MTEPSVWEATVDNNTWKAQVTRDSDYRGTLAVTKVDDGTEILRESVGLSYRAIFGPDADDVHLWMVMSIEAIDHYNAHHTEKENK